MQLPGHKGTVSSRGYRLHPHGDGRRRRSLGQRSAEGVDSTCQKHGLELWRGVHCRCPRSAANVADTAQRER
eukprot:7214169-Karenia_brevis.AAC.1